MKILNDLKFLISEYDKVGPETTEIECKELSVGFTIISKLRTIESDTCDINFTRVLIKQMCNDLSTGDVLFGKEHNHLDNAIGNIKYNNCILPKKIFLSQLYLDQLKKEQIIYNGYKPI